MGEGAFPVWSLTASPLSSFISHHAPSPTVLNLLSVPVNIPYLSAFPFAVLLSGMPIAASDVTTPVTWLTGSVLKFTTGDLLCLPLAGNLFLWAVL